MVFVLLCLHGFPPQSKTMAFRLINDTEFNLIELLEFLHQEYDNFLKHNT